MKNSLLISILFCGIYFSFLNGVQAQMSYLDIGTQVENYPKVSWIKGAPIEKFDKNKIYIVELWATWCMPCIAAMPHINSLHNKFKDKGIVFIGQDVMESDTLKVRNFVAKKGADMGYPVAFAGGQGSDFDNRWL